MDKVFEVPGGGGELWQGVWHDHVRRPFDVVVNMTRSANMEVKPGLLHIKYGIQDGPIENVDVSMIRFVAGICAAMLSDGKDVFVACRAGINRSGLVNARTIMFFGKSPHDAIALVRQNREGSLSNASFVNWLMAERADGA